MKRITEHPVISSIITAAIISLAVSIFGDWTAVGKWIGSVFLAIVWLLGYRVPLPVWLLVIIALFVIPTAWRLATYFMRREDEPKREDYHRDIFEGMCWHWEYALFDRGIENSGALCATCLTPIAWGGPHHCRAECETCNELKWHGLARDELQEKVRRQIYRKLNSGEWQDAMEQVRERYERPDKEKKK